MVTTIVIPHNQADAPQVRELASVGDFQEITGGWLEPFDVPSLGITLWASEAAPREHVHLNSRATALFWYYNTRIETASLVVGDVVVSGTVTPEESADVPEQILAGLLTPHEFVVQISPDDDGTWHDTSARFDNIFEAAQWCMLFAHAVRPGPGFRFTVYEHAAEPGGVWGSGSW